MNDENKVEAIKSIEKNRTQKIFPIKRVKWLKSSSSFTIFQPLLSLRV